MVRPSAGTRERIEFGRNQRRKLKRSDHAYWNATQRKQNPVEIILAVNRERIASLVLIKMARMAASRSDTFARLRCRSLRERELRSGWQGVGGAARKGATSGLVIGM
jgi:hypothetical protein